MIKYTRMDIDHVKNSIQHIPLVFKNHEDLVIAVYLFGSFSANNVTPLSDIDIAVLYNESLSNDQMKKLETTIVNDLVQLLGTEEIDLINLNGAPLSFRFNVIKEGRLIYYTAKEKVIDFYSDTVNFYLDIKPRRDEINQALIEGILKD